MRQFSDHDVVVVGGGPTAMTLAGELALAGWTSRSSNAGPTGV